MGDAWGGRRIGGSGNAVGDDLHRETTGNRGTVGGAKSTILSVFQVNRVRRGGVAGGRLGGAKRRQRNNFGPPWKSRGRLRGGGARKRTPCSRNRGGEVGRVGNLTCWDRDGRRPGWRMTLCGRQRCWVGDGGRPGWRMNSCGIYVGD